MKIIRTASILPVNARGHVLLQLRDGTPGIPFPHHWSTLGGHLEPGESPEAGARRELWEETGQTVERLHLFRLYRWPAGEEERLAWVFYAPFDVPVEQIRLTEGERVEYMTVEDALRRPLAFRFREVLRDFAEAWDTLDLGRATA
ncbi:MAG TPA: NUDIX domain-containing protein [Dehalococcoidia bacterium]